MFTLFAQYKRHRCHHPHMSHNLFEATSLLPGSCHPRKVVRGGGNVARGSCTTEGVLFGRSCLPFFLVNSPVGSCQGVQSDRICQVTSSRGQSSKCEADTGCLTPPDGAVGAQRWRRCCSGPGLPWTPSTSWGRHALLVVVFEILYRTWLGLKSKKNQNYHSKL